MEAVRYLDTEFVSNNKSTKTIVLKELQMELLRCDRFSISVAFITMSGLTMILQQLKELRLRGVEGRILTSEYQYFNDPKVFHRLMSIPNIEVRIYGDEDHHTKGYIFEKDSKRTVMIGSSNLTQNALKVNKEWNLKIYKNEDSKVIETLYDEFEEMWDKAHSLTTEWIENYTQKYRDSRIIRKELRIIEDKVKPVVPNIMQTEALRNLEMLRKRKEGKALLISATGTGKTYLSAFDVRNAKSKRTLFIIHREQIARDAERTFKKVMPEKTTGILSGTRREVDRDIVFTTIQSISRDHILSQFPKDHFDYIIYDEAHRTGARSYQKVMEYFTSSFTLGMTATPERTDDFNIFELFDYNIAYEIRLNDALEEDMLVPFHYFGVTDVTIDGEVIDDQTTISKLVSQHRIETIISQANYYGYSGDRVKGLIFCSRNDEALALSKGLNQSGLRTVSLSGADSQEEREHAIMRLTDDHGDLDYIISVDIFNEGIDIPKINQIIMLRPTQSAIIFVQQLGRGLRKHAEKDYLVVIDFIGNYKNNFLIPIALSGDRSYSKNNMRKYIMEGNTLIPGTSTIEFDMIAKERIYQAINKENFSTLKHLRKEYEDLKYRLGRIPKLKDFLEQNSLDPQVMFSRRQYDNYHKFKQKVDKTYNHILSSEENAILSFVSYEFSSGKRTIELEVIERLLQKNLILFTTLYQLYEQETVDSMIRYLSLQFLTQTERNTYMNISLIEIDEIGISISRDFKKALNNIHFKDELLDVIEYGYEHSKRIYHSPDELGLMLAEQYTRKDVSWLLNWVSNQQGTMFGYKVDHATKTIPLFVTYKKSGDIDESIMYNDHFIDQSTFNWMSRNRLTLESDEIKAIINAEENGYAIPLFVKRSDGEDKFFYYLGETLVQDARETTITSKGKVLPIVSFTLKLKNPVRDDLYYYLLEE